MEGVPAEVGRSMPLLDPHPSCSTVLLPAAAVLQDGCRSSGSMLLPAGLPLEAGACNAFRTAPVATMLGRSAVGRQRHRACSMIIPAWPRVQNGAPSQHSAGSVMGSHLDDLAGQGAMVATV